MEILVDPAHEAYSQSKYQESSRGSSGNGAWIILPIYKLLLQMEVYKPKQDTVSVSWILGRALLEVITMTAN
jgi:hypothetical protein